MLAQLSLSIKGSETSLHVNSKEGDPYQILDTAIKALQAELEELDRCPVHKKLHMAQGEWY